MVDYVGLTNNLTDALQLYAATDEQQELVDGLKNIQSEMPVLQERYQRILTLFSQNKVASVKEYPTAWLEPDNSSLRNEEE